MHALKLLRFYFFPWHSDRRLGLPSALLAALMLAGCSADPALERPAPAPEKPSAAHVQHPPRESPRNAAAPNPDTTKSRGRRDIQGNSPPPAPGISKYATKAAPARIRRSNTADKSALRPTSPAQPKKTQPETKARAVKRPKPRRKYHGWAGIAVRRLPYADYQGLLPHLNGVASWYGPAFHGKKTASGEVYNQFELTAAHPRLPMGTRIMVENQETRARVWVRINDRGPYKKGRILDLSRAAAARLGMIKKGTAPVRIAVVRWPDDMDPKKGLKVYGQFVVQVAAYPDALKAEGERRGLKSRFGNMRFRLDQTPRGLYSIWIGPYNDEPAAQRTAATLRKGGVFSLVRAYRK